jgi:hypothetical protein
MIALPQGRKRLPSNAVAKIAQFRRIREEEFAGKAEGDAAIDAAEDASDREKEILHRVLTVKPTTSRVSWRCSNASVF